MSSELKILEPPERVLSTLNEDGSRRWIRPRFSHGGFFRQRRIVAYALMLIFFLIPYIRMNGKPLMLLDLPRREFTLFGTTFMATETVLFMLLLGAIFVGIFLVTALVGRAWCGWTCPQTVYMEFLFRPVEYWLEGGPRGSRQLDAKKGIASRRLLKYVIYLVLAMFLAHVFLAYFVGVDTLAQWVRRSPVAHPTTFFIMLGTTGLIFFDFAYFREQTCLVACPYGRIQSVLLDRQSVIVGYDTSRGEPRMKGVKDRPEPAGDCIDCGNCVTTCPTGIDIRDGLQMECIHCTQCADACDAVMVKIGKPRGLIRYTSRDEILGLPRKILRPRVVLYPIALAVLIGLFAFSLGTRANAEITLLRGIGAPYTREDDGTLLNQVRIRVANRGSETRPYTIALDAGPNVRMVAPINPLPVRAGEIATTSVFVVFSDDILHGGEATVTFRLDDGRGFVREVPYQLVGPEDEEKEHHERSQPDDATSDHGEGDR
jgi:cytochrome c oxidase accessory protein FixG